MTPHVLDVLSGFFEHLSLGRALAQDGGNDGRNEGADDETDELGADCDHDWRESVAKRRYSQKKPPTTWLLLMATTQPSA
jgi:hypothetical protein